MKTRNYKTLKLKLEKAYRHSYARELGSNDKDWYLDAYNVLVKVKKENPYWSPWEFVVEDAVRIQGIKTYYNGEREDEPYIDTQWEESDSCWDYYGGLDKVEGWIFEDYGLNKEEFEEVA